MARHDTFSNQCGPDDLLQPVGAAVRRHRHRRRARRLRATRIARFVSTEAVWKNRRMTDPRADAAAVFRRRQGCNGFADPFGSPP